MRSLIVVLILLGCFPSWVSAQAVWNGRQYNSRVCSNPNCGMCKSIQRQLEAQRTQAPPANLYPNGDPWRNFTAQEANAMLEPMLQQPSQTVTTMEARSRLVKRCNGRNCWYETVTEMVPVTRQVAPVAQPVAQVVPQAQPAPVAAPPLPAKPLPSINTLANTELVPTPQAVVNAMLEALCPSNKSKLFDLGSGDGRIVITAAKQFGCTAVGIELNAETIAIARANAINEYVNPLVVFFQGDVRNYDLQSAEYVTMYLYPELMSELMPKIKQGTQIASYQHEIPGIANIKHSIDVNGQTHIFYTGIKP